MDIPTHNHYHVYMYDIIIRGESRVCEITQQTIIPLIMPG
jgi:hypothetical protein